MSNSLEIVVNLYTVIGKVGSKKLAGEVGNQKFYMHSLSQGQSNPFLCPNIIWQWYDFPNACI